MKQLRRLACSPAHLTHESDLSLLHRLHVVPVLEKVSLGCVRLLRRMLITMSPQVCPCCHLDPCLQQHHEHSSTWWSTLLQGLARQSLPFKDGYSSSSDVGMFVRTLPEEQLHEPWLLGGNAIFSPPRPMLLDSSQQFSCRDCGRSFNTYTQLRSHQRHGTECGFVRKLQTYDSSIDARSPTPKCHWCQRTFLWWYQVQVHIERGHCPQLHDREAFLQGRDTRPSLHFDLDLHTHCLLCGRWCKFARSLSKHLKHGHAEAYALGRSKYQSLSFRGMKLGRQCPYCKLVASPSQISGHGQRPLRGDSATLHGSI